MGDVNDPESTQFCFETPLWNETFPIENQIQFKTIFRQIDPKYIKILNNIRIGKITKSTIKLLTECTKKEYTYENQPTKLLPRKHDTNIINNYEFNKLDATNEKTYTLSVVSTKELELTCDEIDNLSLFTDKEKEYEVEYLMDNIMVEKEIKFRIGTIVMCVVNMNLDDPTPIINGSQGIITEFVGNYPVVKFNNGITKVMTEHIWKSERLPGIAVKQIPLIYAWAITIHKSQGLTLDKALIDIGYQIFECGQTYVALSRIKSLEGLYLKGFDYKKIIINKKVQLFYSKLDNNIVS